MMTEKVDNKKEEPNRALTSPVWIYFKTCEDNPVMANCSLCGIRMSRGGVTANRCGTTNLRRHLLTAHKISLPSSKKKNTENKKEKEGLGKRTKKPTRIFEPDLPSKKANRAVKKSPPIVNLKKKEQPETSEEPVPEADPVMCIKWNTYLSNMTSTLPFLLHDEQFVDVTLACEGQYLKCHKILLAACSPYFYELLSSATCRHPIIMFKDYQFWELQALVAFMYCGEVSVPQSQLPRILRVAEALQIKGLTKTTSMMDFLSDSENHNYCPSETEAPKTKTLALQVKENGTKSPTSITCKNSSKTAKPKHKSIVSPKSKTKLKAAKRRALSSAVKKLKLLPSQKFSPQKSTNKNQSPKNKTDPEEQNLPEDLLSQDMYNAIFEMKDTDGICLPGVDRVSGVDGIFRLEDLEEMKMEMEQDITGVGCVVTNGLHHSDQFDLLSHISPDCKLDDNVDEQR